MKYPLDSTPYPKDANSQPVNANLADGNYVYVRDTTGVIYVVPDAPHMHPKVLGNAQPAIYAGDLTIKKGRVTDVTNLSGTFQFDDEEGLREVAAELRLQGVVIAPAAVRFFPPNGDPPVILE